jgi:hypothetical protein
MTLRFSPYEEALALTFGLDTTFGFGWNDHLDQFKMHGISSGPYLFSNSHQMGESPLQALLGIFNHASAQTGMLIEKLGFKNTQKYLNLIPLYLKKDKEDGGFITRFNFIDEMTMDNAAYPAPLSLKGHYGNPCRIREGNSMIYLPCSTILPNLKNNLYSMQLRQVYIPSVYTNEKAVTTQTFSLSELPQIEDYYALLRSYITEDLKDISASEDEQIQRWLLSR